MDKTELFQDLRQLSLKTEHTDSSKTFVFDSGSDPQAILNGLFELAGKVFLGQDPALIKSFITMAFKTGRLDGYTAGVEAHIKDEPAIILYPGEHTNYEKFGEAIMDAVHQYAPGCLVGTNIFIDGKSIPDVEPQDDNPSNKN